MQKHSTIPYVLVGAGVGTLALLSTKPVRKKLLETYHQFHSLFLQKQSTSTLPIEVGQPDPYDFEDSNMVNEGAIYSVQYYNEKEQQ